MASCLRHRCHLIQVEVKFSLAHSVVHLAIVQDNLGFSLSSAQKSCARPRSRAHARMTFVGWSGRSQITLQRRLHQRIPR